MKPAVGHFVLTAALFVIWIGYLFFLWQTSLYYRPSGEPLVVSVPQVLASDAVVEAEVTSLTEPVVVKAVLWPETKAPVQSGDVFSLPNLAQCKRYQARGRRPGARRFYGSRRLSDPPPFEERRPLPHPRPRTDRSHPNSPLAHLSPRQRPPAPLPRECSDHRSI